MNGDRPVKPPKPPLKAPKVGRLEEGSLGRKDTRLALSWQKGLLAERSLGRKDTRLALFWQKGLLAERTPGGRASAIP